MTRRFRFDRLELAGSLGDLGTLLPIALAMILVNGLDPVGLFLSVGLFYVLAGAYYGVTVPVQPMKVIGAYAVATSMGASQILASGLLLGAVLLFIGATGAITLVERCTPKPVIRGVQLATGSLLMAGGIEFMLGESAFQKLKGAAEPYLALQTLGPVPMGIAIGVAGGLATLLLLDNKKIPAGLATVLGGLLLGLLLGAHAELEGVGLGLHLPEIMPFGFPGRADFTFALFALVLPQLPMTLGNAVLAYTDLSRHYFGERSGRVSNRAACVSMALANGLSFLLGGMPLCHGAGGLAAHYRFGATTAGSNLMIGAVLILLPLLLGGDILAVLHLLPLAVLGVLLVFAGAQLALSVLDLTERSDLFVAVLILGITLASNLAVGFLAGIAAAYCLRWTGVRV
ncbi:MAG: putative sulfate/molybdate transporter [Desulfohalobiaceae bacterium]|nr:putative sulfate/molybdate transporter [Desulfohalobiaceae bacterium]